MRRAMNPEWVTEGDKFVGINLSADYCAEHEWGISKLKDMFGILGETRKPFSDWWNSVTNKLGLVGMEKRTIHNTHKSLALINEGDMYYLGTMPRNWGGNSDEYVMSDSHRREEDLGTYWDEGGFMIASKSKENMEALKAAFDRNDIAIWLGGGGPFENAGLIIAIVSELGKEFVDGMAKSDIEAWQLNKDAVATGIYKKLEKAGKEFMALSPRRQEDGSIHFWLNPQDQQTNQYGWYDVAQLEQWAKDEGPIMVMSKV